MSLASGPPRESVARTVLRRVYCALMILAGLPLAALGVQLVSLGGSPYYLLAGIALCGCAILLWRSFRQGVLAFGLLYLATLLWALWESGLDGWALAPRLAALTVIGLLMLLLRPRAAREPDRRPRWRFGLPAALAVVLIVGIGVVVARSGQPTPGAPGPMVASAGSGDWPSIGNSQGADRFSPLSQLTSANVGRLEAAWTYKLPPNPKGAIANLEVTPLKIGGLLYICSSFNNVTALDAETGREIWRYSHTMRFKGISRGACRGVTYFHAPAPRATCTDRILVGTVDARLIALDARDGRRCEDFGDRGEVDLLKGMGEMIPGYYYPSSPPQIVRGKVVVNGRVADGQFVGEPSGVIRAFDAITGKFAWAFDLGRPDDHGEPPEGKTYTLGTPNSWGPMSADDALGLIYAPLGNATPDYYSGHRRPFDNEYASSVVAIDADTGAARWLFQTTHIDVWDYDVSSQPVLIDLPAPGGSVPALIQPTKRGEIFVLDRRTGKPLRTVEERPVPPTNVPGERVSPTQPFSTGMPSFGGPRLTEAMMWGLTPIDQAICRIRFRQARYEGTMTPLEVNRPTITYPGYTGGVNWGSVSVDTDRMIMVVNAVRMANYNRLLTREEVNTRGIVLQRPGKLDIRGGAVPQIGIPYGADISAFLSPLGVPCQQPPYGTLSAVDLRTGKLMWSGSLGTAEDVGPWKTPSHLPFRLGTPMAGGAITTRSGLTFIAATADRHMRAIDTLTGRELWRATLPAGGQTTPMTYTSAASGRQFVIVAAGGLLGAAPKTGDYIVAFALPRQASPKPQGAPL